jgi:hypothetical protein
MAAARPLRRCCAGLRLPLPAPGIAGDGRAGRGDASMGVLYRDRWITCTDDGIRIRWYYPWGDKHVPYAAIRFAHSSSRMTRRPSKT